MADHSCPGMDSFLDEGGGCVPDFEGGHIVSCDGTNPIPFAYCPFCAEKLPEHDSTDCSDCEHTRAYMESLRTRPLPTLRALVNSMAPKRD